MRILLTFIVLLCTAIHGWAQGNVAFFNDDGFLSSPPDRLVRYDATAASLNPNYISGAAVFSNGAPGLRAQLFYGASTANESSLVAVTVEPRTFKASASPNVGTWFGCGVPLDGFKSGDTVNLQVRVWDISLASSWDAAATLGANYNGLLGESQMFQFAFPTDLLAPPWEYFLNNFQGFNIGVSSQSPQSPSFGTVPEPSTFALMLAGGLCIFIARGKSHRNNRSSE